MRVSAKPTADSHAADVIGLVLHVSSHDGVWTPMDTIFSESTHITTHHDETTVEHNTMSDDEYGITDNTPLEATLGIEPRYRALQALA